MSSCIRTRKGTELTKFNKFEFYYNNPFKQERFSFLFTQSDTFYYKKYSKNGDSLYFSLLPYGQRIHINNFVSRLDSLTLTGYGQKDSEQGVFFTYLDFGNERHELSITRIILPEEFKIFNAWLRNKLDSLPFTYIKNEIQFHYDNGKQNLNKGSSN